VAVADSVVIVRGGPTGLARAMTRTLENVTRAMDRASVETARWGVARMVQETAARKADATAQFKRQWKVVKFPGGAATANTSPYAEFVERGRGPGRMPPVEALEQWILAKGILPKNPGAVSAKQARAAVSRSNRVTGDVYGTKGQRARIRKQMRHYATVYRSKPARQLRHRQLLAGMALGMTRKIAKKGTKAKWLLRDVLDEFIRHAQSRYEAAVRRVGRNPLGRYPKA
jgi:hypothetical protein